MGHPGRRTVNLVPNIPALRSTHDWYHTGDTRWIKWALDIVVTSKQCRFIGNSWTWCALEITIMKWIVGLIDEYQGR